VLFRKRNVKSVTDDSLSGWE